MSALLASAKLTADNAARVRRRPNRERVRLAQVRQRIAPSSRLESEVSWNQAMRDRIRRLEVGGIRRYVA